MKLRPVVLTSPANCGQSLALLSVTSKAEWHRFSFDVIGSGSPLTLLAQSIELAAWLLVNYFPVIITSGRGASTDNVLLTDREAVS